MTIKNKEQMKEEISLSDKLYGGLNEHADKEDIKFAVKRLKEELGEKAIGSKYAEEIIDKVFGDKLTK